MSENQNFFRSSSISTSLVRSPSREPSIDKTIRGAHREELLRLVSFMEEVLFDRWQKLDGVPAHHDERLVMESLAGDLLGIKISKLGWPDPLQTITKCNRTGLGH